MTWTKHKNMYGNLLIRWDIIGILTLDVHMIQGRFENIMTRLSINKEAPFGMH